MRLRKFWGWGWEDAGPTVEQARGLGRVLAERFGVPPPEMRTPPDLGGITLPRPRVQVPDVLSAIAATDPASRAGHTYGKSFRDVVRATSGDFSVAPDAVLLPRGEADVVAVLDWATAARVAVIPYGGGSSVVGGIEPAVGDRYAGAVSLDLAGL